MIGNGYNWKGRKRFYSNEQSRWSNRKLDKNWLPRIPEHIEENDDGQIHQRFVYIDDIPEVYRDEFVLWASDNVKQVHRLIEDTDTDTTDEIIKCVDVRIWERWLKKKLKG